MQSGNRVKLERSPYKRSMKQVAASAHYFRSLYSLHAEPKLETNQARKMREILERIVKELDERADVWR